MTSYKQKFNKKFKQPLNESNSKAKMTRLTGIPTKVLDEIFDRGSAAFYNNPSSVRKSVKTPEAWSFGRIYAFIMKAYDAKRKGLRRINQDQDLFEKIRDKLK